MTERTLSANIPIPPLELRSLVGPTDLEAFDNPGREPIYASEGLPLHVYDAVFDFGCGCGRLARRLLQQNPRPRVYVGIDVHRGMIDWCKQNLSPIDRRFQFVHHDVYSPDYAAGNTLQLAQPFPVHEAKFSLVIAHSVFTHLTLRQAEYYLSEVSRVLTPEGIAFTSWFFFDRASFPFRPDVYCLYTSEENFARAVLFDREWFIATVRNLGLGVSMTRPPRMAGHQWNVFLTRRTPITVDKFPLGEDGAEWVSGASLRPLAAPRASPEDVAKIREINSMLRIGSDKPAPPPLFGTLAEVARLRRSWSWRIGRALTLPFRIARSVLTGLS